jgi:hypothetical protein
MLVLAACGSRTTTPPVAALVAPSTSASTSAGAGGATAPSDSDAGRPVMPVGATDEQFASAYNVYHHCLIDHGASAGAQPSPVPGKPVLVQIAGPTPAAAQAACLHVLPLPAPQLDASTNPGFHRESLAYVACMQRQGLFVTLLNDHSLDWDFADGHAVPDNSDQIERDCLLRAFGGSR